jgi:hypothetical protein
MMSMSGYKKNWLHSLAYRSFVLRRTIPVCGDTDVWLGPRQEHHVAGAVNILILLHVFLFILIVEQDIVFIHDAVFFFLARVCVCVCVCLLHKHWGLSWVTWCTFHSYTFPQIIWSFFFIKEKMLSGFAMAHPGQCRVPLLVTYIV